MSGKRFFGQKTDRRTFNEPEHRVQAELVAWIKMVIATRRLDGLRLEEPASLRAWQTIHSIPNGGKRNRIVAMKMVLEGQRPGVSDMFWPLARAGYHGLYLETKVDEDVITPAGKRRHYRTDLSPEQRAFKADVEAQGYAHRTYRSFEEGRAILTAYFLGELLPEPEPPAPKRKPNVAAIAALRQRRP